ncbi:hypothetical protein BC833DRAFT_524113 [Globomyces pollinis-pini]|nr:hypothetical protein BC833DRAFT_524113 [Globomyces pollinis-pini]
MKTSLNQDKLNEQKEQRTLEYYQVKVSDLNEKLEKFKLKVENLSKENTTLAKTQAKFYSDKQDIVEFLNIKVGEHEKMISSLESRNRILEDDKKQMDQEYTTKIDQLNKRYQDEIEQLNNQVMKFKTELVELSSFQVQKDEMEEQLKMYKALLERKENEYRETIHNLERKVLQDKSQMKREMLQKVNEAVANFRRVADQQMAETTKRAIRENMSITAQLKKMSSKTVEFITENENLTEKLKKYKTKNALLMDSEKELAKRNFANQKVIRMLVEKLKECDQMLELAFDSQGNVIAQDPFSDPNSEKQYLTPEMIDEIKLLQDDYEVLVSRIKSFDTIGNDLSAFVGEVENALSAGNEKEYKLILDYLQSNLRTITDKYCF